MAGTAGAAFIAAQWPGMAAAAQHAHETKASGKPYTFEALTPEQAKEVEAIAARIIPTDESAGATEAGVVYFIDASLKGYAKEQLPEFAPGLREINELTAKTFPGVSRFSMAKPEQQDKVLELLFAEAEDPKGSIRIYGPTGKVPFIETLRTHVIAGYLITPERGGNRDYAGWKAIGRDPAHSFSSPFGFYDKDYPGWKPAGSETEKK